MFGVPQWWSRSQQVWGPAGWSARQINTEKSQWCWNISRALRNPEHRDQTMLTTCQASQDTIVFTLSRKDLYFPRGVLLTCFAGHSHHALLLLPKADVILERQEIKEELKKNKQKNSYNIFIMTSPLNRQNYKHLSLWFVFFLRTCNQWNKALCLCFMLFNYS